MTNVFRMAGGSTEFKSMSSYSTLREQNTANRRPSADRQPRTSSAGEPSQHAVDKTWEGLEQAGKVLLIDGGADSGQPVVQSTSSYRQRIPLKGSSLRGGRLQTRTSFNDPLSDNRSTGNTKSLSNTTKTANGSSAVKISQPPNIRTSFDITTKIQYNQTQANQQDELAASV